MHKADWVQKAYTQYTEKRQTLNNLSDEYGISPHTIRRYFDRHEAVTGEIRVPRHAVNLIIDATFFSRRYGVLVARAEGRNILWREIETESIIVYELFLRDLTAAGVVMASCTIDGRPGVRQLLQKMFPGLPIQLCQFHQIQIVTRYLSCRPKLTAGQELRRISMTLTRTDRIGLQKDLNAWHERWKDFLKAKTSHPTSKRWWYTHRRIRSAYGSLMRNIPWLFTHQDFFELHIPSTTNSCDGSFAHWKAKLGIHRGLTAQRWRKMLHYLLEHT